jgi:hypothetical protein
MTDLKVVQMPVCNVQNLPAGLRNLADLIENGANCGAILGLTDATHVIWITTNENGDIESGAMGPAVTRYHVAGLMVSAAYKLAGVSP